MAIQRGKGMMEMKTILVAFIDAHFHLLTYIIHSFSIIYLSRRDPLMLELTQVLEKFHFVI
jgi:succinate dehydrogenase flavin-adding protein (antitoxin of CptAB toxin-antitoxin module)